MKRIIAFVASVRFFVLAALVQTPGLHRVRSSPLLVSLIALMEVSRSPVRCPAFLVMAVLSSPVVSGDLHPPLPASGPARAAG